MLEVARHEILKQTFIQAEVEKFERRLENRKKALLERPKESVGGLLNGFLDGAVYACTSGMDPAAAMRYFQLFKKLALANFRLGAGQEDFTEEFDGEKIQFVPERKTDFMAFNYWKKAFDASLILRDLDGVKFLANVPENVFEESNQGAKALDLALFRFLGHFFKGGRDTGKLLVACYELAKGPHDNPVREDYVNLIRFPELQLYRAMVSQDAAEFNAKLHDALLAHREFWGTEENAMATEGWISWPLLAVCAAAVDAKQFKIEVESDYIPRWLIMARN